jgi:hypothetical protein
MIMLGPGFNFLRPGYWHYYNMLPEEVRARVDAGVEHIKIKMKYGGVGILRKDFCDNSEAFEIDFSQPINITCPVRIIHAHKVRPPPSVSRFIICPVILKCANIAYGANEAQMVLKSANAFALGY